MEQEQEQDPRHVRARTLRIDPVARTVTASVDTWETAREWIGADLLERVGCGAGADLWIDEEGMLRDEPDLWVLGGEQLLAGRGVLVGGVGGEWCDLPIPAEVAAGAVAWLPDRMRSRAREIAAGMRPVALAWNEAGMQELARMQREQQGWVEMLAVASEPATLGGAE